MTLNGKLKKSRSGNFLNIYEVVRNILESNFTTTRPLFEKIIASQTTASLLQEKGVSKSFFEVKNSQKHFFQKFGIILPIQIYIDIFIERKKQLQQLSMTQYTGVVNFNLTQVRAHLNVAGPSEVVSHYVFTFGVILYSCATLF